MAELLVTLALIAIVSAVAVPAVGNLLGARSLDAAAAVLAGEMARARHEAIARHRYAGLAFERAPEADRFGLYIDGGQAGIQASEIATGVDGLLRGPFDITAFGGVRLGIPGPGPVPKVPPSRGSLRPGDDPVQFGGTDIVSYSPNGESSSGALYLMDARGGLRAIVVYGRTARIRVWKFDSNLHVWRQ